LKTIPLGYKAWLALGLAVSIALIAHQELTVTEYTDEIASISCVDNSHRARGRANDVTLLASSGESFYVPSLTPCDRWLDRELVQEEFTVKGPKVITSDKMSVWGVHIGQVEFEPFSKERAIHILMWLFLGPGLPLLIITLRYRHF